MFWKAGNKPILNYLASTELNVKTTTTTTQQLELKQHFTNTRLTKT